MYFKPLERVLVGIGVALALSACTLKLNEPQDKAKVIAVNPVEAGCLSNMDVIFQNYFAGKISQKELSDFWDCLETSFRLFMENTTGADKTMYTPDELAKFLETFFLGDKKLSPTLVHEAMVLKKAVLGGSDQAVTRDELRQSIDLMEVFRKETLTLLPYLPFTLDQYRIRDLPPDKFDQTATVFHAALENIGAALDRSVGPYPFDSLERLLDELDHFLYADRHSFFDYFFSRPQTWTQSTKNFVEIVRNAKSVFISPPADVIGKNDWRAIFRLAPRYYTLYLRVSLLMNKPLQIFSGEALQQIFRLGSLSHEYISESVRQHPNHLISETELKNLVNALGKADVLPLQSKTVDNFIPILTNKFLRDLNNPIGVPTNGISEAVLDRLWNSFTLWSEGQFYLEGLFHDRFGDGYKEGELKKDDFLAIPAADGLKWTVFKNEHSLEAILEIRKNVAELRAAFPMITDEATKAKHVSDHVIVPRNRAEISHNLASLSIMNLLRTGSRFLIQGYAKDLERARLAEYLTQDEVAEIYNDIFPVANDLGLLTDPNPLSVVNRIVEADLFLPSADGDSNLSQDEATELLSIVISSARVGSAVQVSIAHTCLDKPGTPFDPRAEARPVPANCYFQKLGDGLPAYWDHVPGLVDFYESLRNNPEEAKRKMAENFVDSSRQNDSLDWLNEKTKELEAAEFDRPPADEFLYAIDKVIRKLDNPDERAVEPGDATGYILISYYLEYLFDRYDVDHSNTMSKDESWRAYPVFRGFIAKKALDSGLDKEDDFKALFHYLLKYQSIPSDSLCDKIRYFWNRYIHSTGYETNRLQVARLLAKLLKL